MAGNSKEETLINSNAKLYTSACRQCGNLMQAGAVFCTSCGALPETDTAADTPNPKPAAKTQPADAQAAKKLNIEKNEKQQKEYKAQSTAGIKKSSASTDKTADFDPADIKKNQNTAPIAYLNFLFLFLKAMYPDSEYIKFHVRQGFVLFCFETAFSFAAYFLVQIFKYPDASQIIRTPGWLTAILWMCAVPIIVLTAAGMINAGQGKAVELPYIGKYAEHAGFLD